MSSMSKLRSMDANVIVDAYKQAGSITGTATLLDVSAKAPCVRELIREIILRTDPTVLRVMAKRNSYSVDDIRAAVSTSICMSEVLRKLGLTTHGACANTIKRLMNENNIEYSHFDIKAAMKKNKKTWAPDEVFVENSPIPRATLHNHVKRHGVLGTQVCAECAVESTYNGKPLRLTVDHINGISNDNRVENLRWLCPNCHSQTDTYCGKNS